MLERDREGGSVRLVSWCGYFSYCVLKGSSSGRSSVEVHGSCDGRISLYPAAPIRLATLLHAWTYRAGRMGLIARTAEGLGPSCEAVPQSHIRPARRAQRERRNPCMFSELLSELTWAPPATQEWRPAERARARHSARARSPACAR